MPAAGQKSRKKPKVPAKKTNNTSTKRTSKKKASFEIPRDLLISLVAGVFLGLSAPGFNQAYIAWFGLVPFLLLVVSSTGLKQAFLRGLLFGTAYNLMYGNWFLHLHPLDWMGFSLPESIGVSSAVWFITAFHQGLIVSIVALAIRMIPTTGGFIPRSVEERWRAPALLVIPLLWVVLQNKVCNAHDWLGVPWSMLEYSQYKMLPLLQIASWIGGIGIGFLIVAINCVLAGVVATFTANLNFKALAYPTRTSAMAHALAMGLVVAACVVFGYGRLATENESQMRFAHAASQTGMEASVPVSVVQGNINIDMQKKTHGSFSLDELVNHYRTLVAQTPPGLCIWTESALPTYIKDEKQTLDTLREMARSGKRDMIVGSLDRDFDGHPYNSAFGITSGGELTQMVYHKRYLVPLGEYMPRWVKYMPEWMQKLTSTPAGTGFNSGKVPVVIDLSGKRIAPLICFETVSPELVVTSVRNGGNLLVNLSDLAWFHQSMCGDQMLAFSVLRSVESGRDFVFAANTGPSAIINRFGRITARSPQAKFLLLSGKVHFHSDRTPFVQWFN